MAVYKKGSAEGNGCYKVKGVSFQDWDGVHNRSTRIRLKREDAILLSEALDPSEDDNKPGAFGEGRNRRRNRRQDKATRELRWWFRYRQRNPGTRLPL